MMHRLFASLCVWSELYIHEARFCPIRGDYITPLLARQSHCPSKTTKRTTPAIKAESEQIHIENQRVVCRFVSFA